MSKNVIDTLIEKGDIKIIWLPIDDVKENPNNPRHISDADLEALKKSIQEFPDMLRLRPGVVDANIVLMGGNQRRKACKSLGWDRFPVIMADDLTPEQLREFIIKDNLPFGEWDTKMLKTQWDVPVLGAWGMDVTNLIEKQVIPGAIVFSPELDQESNYVVLKFNRDVDWLQVQTLLGIEAVYSARQNGRPWSKGQGRVVDGVRAIQLIQESAKQTEG